MCFFKKNNCILICLLITDTKNMTTTTNFDSARVFSSFNMIQLIGWNRLPPLSNSNFFKANALKINTNAFKIIHSKSFISKSFIQSFNGSKGWRSSEGAHLPPMWPGFNSRRWRHMWVEFVVGSLPCSKRFFSGYSGFPLSSKTNTSKFQFNLEPTEALRG